MAFILKDLPDYLDMSIPTLRVGICQVFTKEWDIEANIGRTITAIDLASSQGAEIAVTPECVFHGYPVDETRGESKSFRKKLFDTAESLDGEHLKIFIDKAKESRIYILLGFVEKGEHGLIHNSAALISPSGNFVYIYRKVHCRHFENINHWGYYTPGNNYFSSEIQIDERTFNIGTIICFDREIPESLRCLRALGAELVLCPLATDTDNVLECRQGVNNEIITSVGSASNEQFIVVVNHSGRYNGGSFIVGPKGELFCRMDAEPGVLTYEIPLGIISKKFHNEPLGWMGWGYRRGDVYSKYI